MTASIKKTTLSIGLIATAASLVPLKGTHAATKHHVTFESGGETLVGHLYMPKSHNENTPTFVILGPMTFQKEQAPTEYATRLAEQGFAALAFDTRYRGESGGEPRALENTFHKVEDLKNAVSFIKGLAGFNADSIYALGICQGSSAVVNAVAQDDNIKGGITLAGHYRDREGDIAWLTKEGFETRLAKGQAALDLYERTGEVEYVAGVDETDMNVGMPGKFVWDWYHVWEEKGLWENRYAVMSDAALLSFESISAAAEINKPYLMIHSDNSFLPDAARRHFNAMPSKQKTLLWEGETPHLAYYDQPEILDRTTLTIANWVDRIEAN
ncbi:alpha/beta hydrolase [Ningiella sp. W23]|uniref:alpha/beta hydrolase n=1 Tax=Ningiella sp. W23 TaxID=3023715 RepID=UPI0037572FFA